MFCEKCGSEIPESVICPKCGCLSGYKNKTAHSAAVVRKRKDKYESAANAVMIAAVVIMAVQIIFSVIKPPTVTLYQLINCSSIVAYLSFAVLFLLKKRICLKVLIISMIANLLLPVVFIIIYISNGFILFKPWHLIGLYEPWHIAIILSPAVICSFPLVFAILKNKNDSEILNFNNIESPNTTIKIMFIIADVILIVQLLCLIPFISSEFKCNPGILGISEISDVPIQLDILDTVIPCISYIVCSVLYLLKKQIYLKLFICTMIYNLLAIILIEAYMYFRQVWLFYTFDFNLISIVQSINPAILCILPVLFILLKQQKAEQKRI